MKHHIFCLMVFLAIGNFLHANENLFFDTPCGGKPVPKPKEKPDKPKIPTNPQLPSFPSCP